MSRGRPGARQPRRERVAGGRRGTFRAGRPSPREPSAGEGARCPARATCATAAAARSEAPGPGARARGRPAAGRGRRAASSGRRPVRRGSPRGGDHFPGLGRRAASKGRRATLQTALLRCAAGSSVSPTARHAARRIIEGARIFCGVIVGVNPLRTVGTARVAMGLRFFRAECCGRVRTPGTDPRGEG